MPPRTIEPAGPFVLPAIGINLLMLSVCCVFQSRPVFVSSPNVVSSASVKVRFLNLTALLSPRLKLFRASSTVVAPVPPCPTANGNQPVPL